MHCCLEFCEYISPHRILPSRARLTSAFRSRNRCAYIIPIYTSTVSVCASSLAESRAAQKGSPYTRIYIYIYIVSLARIKRFRLWVDVCLPLLTPFKKCIPRVYIRLRIYYTAHAEAASFRGKRDFRGRKMYEDARIEEWDSKRPQAQRSLLLYISFSKALFLIPLHARACDILAYILL